MNPAIGRFTPQMFSPLGMSGQSTPASKIGEGMVSSFEDNLKIGLDSMKSSQKSGAAGSGSFVSAIGDFVQDVDAMSKRSDVARASILSGDSNNIHQAMIASKEASLSFSLMLEMRNKLLETYQELMRIQV
jgi:flagellar hook-basal body complex protein FliE